MKHRIIEAERHRRRRADRQVGVKIDDALMIVGQQQFALRAHHSVRLDAADEARLEIEAGARNMRARRGEKADQAGSGIGRAAHHLDPPGGGLDIENPQAIGIGMRPRLDHPRHGEGRERLSRVADALDLEAGADQPAADLFDRRPRVEIILEPAERELHVSPPASEGTSSARKP